MTQRSMGNGWRRYGAPTDLGQDPLVFTLEAALKAPGRVSLRGELGSNTFFTRTRGNIVRVALVIDPSLTFCFQEDRTHLMSVLEVTSEEFLLKALYLMGQKAKVGSADLTEAEAKKWLGV